MSRQVKNSGEEMCKQSNPHLMIIFDGLMLFVQFLWSPQGRGIKLTFLDFSTLQKPFLKRSEALDSCRILHLQIIYCSVKMHNNHSTWYSLGVEGIIREFLSPWRKSGIDRKEGFCIISPETAFSVLAVINQSLQYLMLP